MQIAKTSALQVTPSAQASPKAELKPLKNLVNKAVNDLTDAEWFGGGGFYDSDAALASATTGATYLRNAGTMLPKAVPGSDAIAADAIAAADKILKAANKRGQTSDSRYEAIVAALGQAETLSTLLS